MLGIYSKEQAYEEYLNKREEWINIKNIDEPFVNTRLAEKRRGVCLDGFTSIQRPLEELGFDCAEFSFIGFREKYFQKSIFTPTRKKSEFKDECEIQIKKQKEYAIILSKRGVDLINHIVNNDENVKNQIEEYNHLKEEEDKREKEKKIREDNPSLQTAWEHYNILLTLHR